MKSEEYFGLIMPLVLIFGGILWSLSAYVFLGGMNFFVWIGSHISFVGVGFALSEVWR